MTTQYVKIYFGPCNSFHSAIHKPQKLRGLKDRLQKIGYRVDLVPVKYVNYCMLEMCGHEVFSCNVQNLNFNTSYKRDPVCQRAVQAVVEASSKFSRARSYLWSWQMLEDQIFKRSEHAPIEHFTFDFNLPPFQTCKNCADCCGILIKQKDPKDITDGNTGDK